MSFNYSPKIVTDGLLLYLDAANPKSIISGSTTWTDLSRSNYNATLVNSPTFTTEKVGTIYFDGANDYGTLPMSFKNQMNLMTEITMITWVNISAMGYTNVVLGLSLAAQGTTGFWMTSNATQGLYFTFRRPFTNTNGTAYYGLISDIGNRWIMLVGRSNSTSTKATLYDTGKITTREQTGQVALENIDTSYVATIAGVTTGSGGSTNLHMGMSQVYNRYLTDFEVTQIYNTTKSRYGL